MNYSEIRHTEKNVYFRSGKTGKELYFHIKTENLFIDYKEFLKDFDNYSEKPQVYGYINWEDPICTHKNNDLATFTLSQVVESFVNKLLDIYRCDDQSWTGTIRDDGLYLNIRLYKFN